MQLTLISSLDALCRQQACEAAAAENPGAVMVLHDLLEDGLVLRRLIRDREILERMETHLEHGCLSCTVRLDVVPTVERLLERGERTAIIGLPPGVSLESAAGALQRGLPGGAHIANAVLACAPDALEDHIWDRHTLFESGFTAAPDDHRTPGEFLLGELCFSDTVLLAEPDVVPADPAMRRRGLQLIPELAPHAHIAAGPRTIRPGSHDCREALGRSNPGAVRIPASSGASPFTTVVHRSARPLHPRRFQEALPSLAEGCTWLRGRLWIASAPTRRIAIQGIGPRVWLENTGPWLADRSPEARAPLEDVDGHLDWHPVHGDRCTVIAATGAGLDATEIAALLSRCELTDAEMAAGFGNLPDPFHLDPEPGLDPPGRQDENPLTHTPRSTP